MRMVRKTHGDKELLTGICVRDLSVRGRVGLLRRDANIIVGKCIVKVHRDNQL